MTAFEKVKNLLAATEKDAHAFHTKGNKAAGTRLRKAYQEIKTTAQQGRAEVSALKSNAKKK
ncbi:MAG: histone H1 [Mucilaginibacter sp.]|uniref:histone H1 n=1 Tax=Mucilaginibacter sp. TaxID=1882438 RepID=UPI0032638710